MIAFTLGEENRAKPTPNKPRVEIIKTRLVPGVNDVRMKRQRAAMAIPIEAEPLAQFYLRGVLPAAKDCLNNRLTDKYQSRPSEVQIP